MDDVIHCEECGMSYIPTIAADRKRHDEIHNEALNSYKRTLASLQPVWTARPVIENAGVYRALNEMNPNLRGFSFLGLSDPEKATIEDGSKPLSVGKSNGGDGHDRYGQWGLTSFTQTGVLVR